MSSSASNINPAASSPHLPAFFVQAWFRINIEKHPLLQQNISVYRGVKEPAVGVFNTTNDDG